MSDKGHRRIPLECVTEIDRRASFGTIFNQRIANDVEAFLSPLVRKRQTSHVSKTLRPFQQDIHIVARCGGPYQLDGARGPDRLRWARPARAPPVLTLAQCAFPRLSRV